MQDKHTFTGFNFEHKKGQAPHSTQLLRIPLLPSGPDGVLPTVVAWDPTLNYHSPRINLQGNEFLCFGQNNKIKILLFPFAILVIKYLKN